MGDIVSQVSRVNDLISEISAAAVEQTAGVGQIAEAVSQLDQVTQQNAALVEESAAAADSLSQQAGRLVDAVKVFRLPSDARQAAAPSLRLAPQGDSPAILARQTIAKAAAHPAAPSRLNGKFGVPARAPRKTGATELTTSDDWTNF
jgi:methyl-accepting chemotaxis protein